MNYVNECSKNYYVKRECTIFAWPYKELYDYYYYYYEFFIFCERLILASYKCR